jgi:hypothetical protein
MKGRWLHNKDIDLKKWDTLVNSCGDATVFNTAHYLSAVCSDWCAYLTEDYSLAIPVGVSRKLGVNSIYPPLFHRYSEILGDISKFDLEAFTSSMLKTFPEGNLNFKTDHFGNIAHKNFIYQTVSSDEYKLKSQARRMLKKFDQSSMRIEINNNQSKEVLTFIKAELSKKMKLYAKNSAIGLDRIISDLPKEIKLITLVLLDGDQFCGGLIGLEFNNTILYLKGATASEAKKNGGMYALMNELIKRSFEKEKYLDFGGSRVDGVRFFNTRFNAQDKTYFCYHWDNTPIWYKLLKRMNQWRKK